MAVGTILAYSADASGGVIECEQKKKYYFDITQWLSKDVPPTNDLQVTFDPAQNNARNVKVVVKGK